MSFKATFSSQTSFKASFKGTGTMTAVFSPHINVPVVHYYDGAYTITPSAEEQTIPIRGLTGRQNITVEAIPNNYGLITWNGATLTVS